MSQTACTMMAEANTWGSRASSTDSYAGIFKGMGHQPEYRAERKRQIGRRRQRIHSRIWGNRMAGQRNAFEHMKSQLEQYRGQADTCQNRSYSSQSSKNIMDRVNPERGRKKPFTGILIVVIIWLVFSVGGKPAVPLSPTRSGSRSTESRTSSTRPAAISGPLPIPMPWRSWERASSDEEVRAIGTNCTNYGHYDAQLAE